MNNRKIKHREKKRKETHKNQVKIIRNKRKHKTKQKITT